MGIKLNGVKVDILLFLDGIAVIAQNEKLQRMKRYIEETLLNELNTKINIKNTRVLVYIRNKNIGVRIHL